MAFNIEAIKDLEGADVFMALSVFVATIAGGGLTVFLYDQGLFKSLELAKLIILSLSISMPVLVFNAFTIHALYPQESAIKGNITAAGFITTPVIYFAILVKYFFDVSLGTYIATIISLEILFVLVISFEFAKK